MATVSVSMCVSVWVCMCVCVSVFVSVCLCVRTCFDCSGCLTGQSPRHRIKTPTHNHFSLNQV